MAKQYNWLFLKTVGERIAYFRHKAQLSQEELAAQTNLHRTYIGFIEQGKRDPSVGSLERIANALNVPLQNFFDPSSLQVAEDKTPYKETKKSSKD